VCQQNFHGVVWCCRGSYGPNQGSGASKASALQGSTTHGRTRPAVARGLSGATAGKVTGSFRSRLGGRVLMMPRGAGCRGPRQGRSPGVPLPARGSRLDDATRRGLVGATAGKITGSFRPRLDAPGSMLPARGSRLEARVSMMPHALHIARPVRAALGAATVERERLCAIPAWVRRRTPATFSDTARAGAVRLR